MNTHLASIIALLNWFDWVLLTIIAISTVYGLFRGFVKEAVTTTAWALAAWLSYMYAQPLSVYLESSIETASMRVALMVLLVFIVVLSSSAIIRSGIRWAINRVGLIGLDYVLGGLFGVARGIVIAMLLMILLLNLGFNDDQWWKDAHIGGKLSKVMDMIPEHLPKDAKVMYKRIAMR